MDKDSMKLYLKNYSACRQIKTVNSNEEVSIKLTKANTA